MKEQHKNELEELKSGINGEKRKGRFGKRSTQA